MAGGVVGLGYSTSGGGGGGAPADAQFLVGAADATLSNERVATSGQRVSVTLEASTATFEGTVSRGLVLIEDEFYSGSTNNGQIGILGWAVPAGGMTGRAGELSHPGMYILSSTTASGTIGRCLLLTGLAANSWVVGDVGYMALLMRPQVGTTVMSFRFGMLASATATTETSQGVYWSFDPATSANWRTITRDGGGVTANTTATAYSLSTFYFLEITRASNGTDWEFRLNGTLRFTHSANLVAGTTGFAPGFYIETNEAVAKTADIDYFALVSNNPLGARF